jgi:hypothetical protein
MKAVDNAKEDLIPLKGVFGSTEFFIYSVRVKVDFASPGNRRLVCHAFISIPGTFLKFFF